LEVVGVEGSEIVPYEIASNSAQNAYCAIYERQIAPSPECDAEHIANFTAMTS